VNVGALIGLLKLAQDTGFTQGYRAERPDFIWGPKKVYDTVSVIKPIAKKITLPLPTLTYEQTLGGGPSRLGLRPKGL
jgi:hypothetical protein